MTWSHTPWDGCQWRIYTHRSGSPQTIHLVSFEISKLKHLNPINPYKSHNLYVPIYSLYTDLQRIYYTSFTLVKHRWCDLPGPSRATKHPHPWQQQSLPWCLSCTWHPMAWAMALGCRKHGTVWNLRQPKKMGTEQPDVCEGRSECLEKPGAVFAGAFTNMTTGELIRPLTQSCHLRLRKSSRPSEGAKWSEESPMQLMFDQIS